MNEDINSNAAFTFNAGAASTGFQSVTLSGTAAPALLVPNGYNLLVPRLQDLEPLLARPTRKRGLFHFGDVDSFIRYFNEHKNDASRIFASISTGVTRFTGNLNFHGKEPDFGDHVAQYSLQPTPEWTKLMENDNDKMCQCGFAQFLDDMKELLIEPNGADLLELVQSLEGHAEAKINQTMRLASGNHKVTYSEEVVVRGSSSSKDGELELPGVLKFSVAPFEGVAPYPVSARMRYDIQERKIRLWYDLLNVHLVVRAVALDLIKIITERTGVEPFRS